MQRAYIPLDAAAAEESCTGTGGAQGAQMTVLVTGAGGFIGMSASIMLHQHGHGEGTALSAFLTRDRNGRCALTVEDFAANGR